MKWVERIELRSVESNRELLESRLQELIHQVQKETPRQAIEAYRRVIIDTDVSIHLVHDSQNVERAGSPSGLSLVSSLKEFGIVNHSVWIEMDDDR